jgi:hypothetical protein
MSFVPASREAAAIWFQAFFASAVELSAGWMVTPGMRALALLSALLLLGVGVAAYWRFSAPESARSPAPADLFMQSVADEDGGLGWDQLCPEVRVQVPREALEQQTLTQRAIHVNEGVTLTVDHVRDQPRPGGGQTRVYAATAHGTDGSTGQKTYVVNTQSSGCVESVE